MAKEEKPNEYQANDADAIIGQIFSGGVTIEEALERLRTRLLDLSARNRLLNYRHPKGRCIQIADKPSINLVFERLYIKGKGVPFKFVPEPPPDTYEGKRPEAKLYATRIGISTSFEFAPNPTVPNGQRLQGIQTLFYPADLERQLRKIAGEAKTAIEETGTNMLFLVFGFLEFYDSEDSEKPMLAPMLSLPVTLLRGEIDRETRTYRYTVQHNGEDLAENHTLREKLRRDFMLSLPEFAEEDKPETYYARIEQAVQNKRRWKVRRQITLGMLSFGKLAIWSDLDTKKNPGLKEHNLIISIFSGGSSSGDGVMYAEDYRIDERPEATQLLIYDADSSQHSAIIDVLSGKNMVINGPPGTGKSQTITNIIAAALSKGKKVLFVSEKLAALEVVRHRLNQAGLGHFCLELHSHKTQKKKFLEDIQARIEAHFPAPSQFQDRLATLNRQKTELARYAELMGSRVGNAIGLTINELFWASERRRQELGALSAEVNAIGFPEASKWTYDDIESRRSRLAGLAELYDEIGRFDYNHPWWGFQPDPLAPSDDEAIARTINKALENARKADAAVKEAVLFFCLPEEPDTLFAKKIRTMLDQIWPIPVEVETSLLARMFEARSDPDGKHSSHLIAEVTAGVTKARELFESASRVLLDGKRPAEAEMKHVHDLVLKRKLGAALLGANIGDAIETVSKLEKATETFEYSSRMAAAPYGPTSRSAMEIFLSNSRKMPMSGLASFTIRSITARASAVIETAESLSEALSRVCKIAFRREIPFDSTEDSIAILSVPHGIPGLNIDAVVDDTTLDAARRFAAFFLADKSISELVLLKLLLEKEISAYAEALEHCRQVADRLQIEFDSTDRAVAETVAIAKIAACAPEDLLEYRRETYGHVRTTELIEKIQTTVSANKSDRAVFDTLFYLDALPKPAEIKSAVFALRRKNGFIAFFDSEWRMGKKLHAGLSKEKRKLTGKQRAEELAKLASWIEDQESFISDPELKECFGGLFRGLETDPIRISQLNDWYLTSRKVLLGCPGFVDKVNLTAIPSERLSELATKAASLIEEAKKLSTAEDTIRDILGKDVVAFQESKVRGWDAGLETLKRVAVEIENVTGFFSPYVNDTLSPQDALRLMEAKSELNSASPDLALLMNGKKAIREAGGDELGYLADLVKGVWTEALPEIIERASIAAKVAEQARAFASENCSLSTAQTFAIAKSDLDAAWSQVSSIPEWNNFDGWDMLTDAALKDAQAARQVLETIVQFSRRGVSAEKVFKATHEENKARAILNRLASYDKVRMLLGDLFDGINTDLNQLSLTHEWGSSVCMLDLPMEVLTLLLSEDAVDLLDKARRIYKTIDDGCRSARETLESLTAWGSFSWDEWQKQVRGYADRDLTSEIYARLEKAAAARGSVLSWSKYLSLRAQARHEGLRDFVIALECETIPSKALAQAFELAAYQSIGRTIYQTFPELYRFNGNVHDKTRADYRALDAEIVSLTGRDFSSQIERRTRVPEGQRGTMVGDFTDMQLLRRELNKQRRHIPIRQLVKRAGAALQELKPCFMMGPLSVAQYLEQGALKFDIVVMDEASQLRPEEALGAIARGSQLVVVGDPKQLPPTTFFDRMLDAGDDEDEDEAPAAISGMESILDICQQLFTPVRSLRWHYRSHHESLIAFSNHHFYRNLIVFPSPYARNSGLGVKYRYVKGGAYRDRQNVPEAQRVVDAILEHMSKLPNESLGVVTLNQTQRELIEELLYKKLKTFKEVTDFMGLWEREGWPFFVKNLENVQGDERDVIFISTTFGKAPGTDKVRQNFGPISRPDGWRRLNVLFTRAKRRVELFTSMLPEDIIVDEKTPLGTKALRDYLDFAKRGVLVTTDENEREPDSDFEVSVANVIMALGYEVKPQLGVAGFFIDLAVRNPDRPGEFLAGIECDGATYHSGFSVRDRDRIRQEILESLGWKGRIHRIWSTDWFYNPGRESERLRSFLDERRYVSATEEHAEWVEDNFEEIVDATKETQFAEELAEVLSATSEVTEDLFVEVGDRVTYCHMDDPNNRRNIFIVDSESNAKMGIVNERTPIAQALLGLSAGDIGDLLIPGQETRQLRVLKIQRQEELLA